MLPVDSFEYSHLIDMEIYEALKLKKHESLAYILYYIHHERKN